MQKCQSLFLATFLLLAVSCGNSKTANQQPQGSTYNYTTTFPKTGVSAGMKFASVPKVRVTNSFVLKFWNTATGNPETGPFLDPGFALVSSELDRKDATKKQVEQDAVFLWMNDMGHGSRALAVTRITDATGTYFNAANVYFSMDDTWQIKVQFHTKPINWVKIKDDPRGREQAEVFDLAEFVHFQLP